MKQLQHRVTVTAQQSLSPCYRRLVLDAPSVAARLKPGQFVNIRVTDGLEPVFRRPFSVYRAQNDSIEIFYDVVGTGTAKMAVLTPGDPLDILGPLGRPFTPPGPAVKRIVMIAGGIGVAPFLALTDAWREKGLEMTLLYGGRGQDQMFDMSAFEDNGCCVLLSTEDGSAGVKGRVSELFEKIPAGSDVLVLTCGPRPMMKAVQEFCAARGLDGECSCEEVMACGIGACLGCVIATTAGYKTVCHDGPVFGLHEVVF
ncbi:MAG: dihydroorotate dehydrogenase electron transfer subunit [Candidatus Omnitrophota bacterium]